MTQEEVEITSDGRTVWVNTQHVCIGRFGVLGIDIHRADIESQSEKGECLHCTHQKTTAQDWTTFQEKMRELHGVTVGDEHKPSRFQS